MNVTGEKKSKNKAVSTVKIPNQYNGVKSFSFLILFEQIKYERKIDTKSFMVLLKLSGSLIGAVFHTVFIILWTDDDQLNRDYRGK